MRRSFIICIAIFLFALDFIAQNATPTPVSTADAMATPEPSQPTISASSDGESKQISEDPPPNSKGYVRKDIPARIPRFEAPPVIDGQLSDAAWRSAAVFGDFLQTNPGDNIAPVAPTEVMMGYDAKNLYIAFHIKQDRDKIRATVARRDNIFSDDYVGFYIDTFNDRRQAYCIFLNPLGVQADGVFTENNGEDYSVDLVMESKGILTPDGYSIELAIPFKSLRYEAGKDKNWGLHIFRRIKYNNNELDSWMRNNRSASGSLSQAGQITGLEGIETTRQLEINPSFTLSESGRRTQYTFDENPAGRYVNDGLKGEFSMTAKFSLTPAITLDFAYNPDFAQVEADAPVTAANQRFPIFFPEKRPFFLERIDIFRSGLNVVNTRAIIDPDIAAKLTGRRGKNTFGIMYASDNAPGNFSKDERQILFNCLQDRTDPEEPCPFERFVNKNADIGVLRFKRDIGKENNLGFFATTYNFVDHHNHTAGFDGRFRFDTKTVAEFQVMGTNSRNFFYNPDLDRSEYRTGNGFGYRVWAERSGRNLYMNYLIEGRSPDYRADVGFTQRADTNYAGSFIQYKTDPKPKGAIIFKRINNASNIRYDWKGRSQYAITESQGMLALQKQTYIGTRFQWGYERVFEHEFGPRRNAKQSGAFFGGDSERSASYRAIQWFVETTPNKQLYLNVFMDNTWGQMDYDFGPGDFPRVSRAAVTLGQDAPFDPGPGHQLYMEINARYQPTTAFQTQLDYTKVRLKRNDTGLVAFDDNIFSSRSTYQFNRDLWARLRLDYSTLSNRVRPQFVLGWTPSPGKAIYVGYTDDVTYNGHNPYTRQYESGFHGNGRTFFIKMSYLFKKSF